MYCLFEYYLDSGSTSESSSLYGYIIGGVIGGLAVGFIILVIVVIALVACKKSSAVAPMQVGPPQQAEQPVRPRPAPFYGNRKVFKITPIEEDADD